MIILLLALVVGVYGDYDCLCNYNVELAVHPTSSVQSPPIGYLYEFDCKELLHNTDNPTWITIAFEHQVGYIEKNGQTQIQVCPGDPSLDDRVTTTTVATTSIATTITTTLPTTTEYTTSTYAPTTTTTFSTQPPTTATSEPPTTLSTTEKPSSTTSSTISTSMSTSSSTTVTTSSTVTSMSASTMSTTLPSSTSPTISSTTFQPSTSPLPASSTRSGNLSCPYSIQVEAYKEHGITFLNDVDRKCYELVSFLRSWTFAENDCVGKGGHLAAIGSQTEELLIYKYVKAYGHPAWIGLNDRNIEEKFEWTSGEPLSYQNWYSGRNTTGSHFTEDCVAMQDLAGSWNDEECQTFLAYVCEFDAVFGNQNIPTTTPTSTAMSTTTRQSSTMSTTTRQSSTVSTTTRQSSISSTDSITCPASIQSAAQRDGAELFTNWYDKKCYEFVKNTLSWDRAENHCKALSGHLVTIGDYIEEDIIYRRVKAYGHEVWIGLNDQDSEENFKWSSGEPVTYQDWHTGRKDPIFHGIEDCVAMGPLTGTWEDMSCLNARAYICEFDAVNGVDHSVTTMSPMTGPTADGDISRCPSSVQHLASRDNAVLAQHDNYCYELITNVKVSWQNGEDMCTSRGGHLAHISSSIEQVFVQAFMQRHSPQHAVWIGLHDTNVEGVFEWTSGDSVRYTHWVPGHQSIFGSFRTEDCVAYIPYQSGYWDDIPCGDMFDLGESHPILCEYKILQTPGIVG